MHNQSCFSFIHSILQVVILREYTSLIFKITKKVKPNPCRSGSVWHFSATLAERERERDHNFNNEPSLYTFTEKIDRKRDYLTIFQYDALLELRIAANHRTLD